MAYLFDRNVIYLGDSTGRRQNVVAIPAQEAADKPGILAFDSVNDSGVRTTYYTWFDSNGVYRYHTSIPTNQDSDGSTITSGANTTLSNLGTVACNTSLISDANNTDDLGSSTYSWRSAYIGTSVVFKETGGNITITTDNPSAARAYSLPDAGADATIMLNAGAANTISYVNGTSTIAFAANADLDIATGCTVNIDQNLTVNTEAVTLNQSLSTTDAVAFATGSTIGNLTLANGSITDSGGSISFGNENLTTTGTINLASDNVYITVGASGATDARIFFDGAGNLMFFDSNQGAARSLTDIYTGTTLNPTVIGDLSISDGNFTWTNTSAAETAVFTLAATTVDGIQINSSNTTADALQITANATVGGNILSLISVDATMTSGAYIYCYDGAAQDFAVRRYGATTIAGSAAGTAALTLTTGDVALSAGRITQTTIGDFSNTFARNNATGTAAVVTIQEANATGGTTLLVNSDATDGNDALQITHDGTGYGLSVIGTAVTGKQALFQGPASQTTSSVFVDGTTGSWVGAATTGMLHLSSDGVLAATTASMLYSNYSGNGGGASNLGTCGYFSDSGAASGTTYGVYISSASNNGAYINASSVGKTALTVAGPSAQTARMLYLDGTTTNGWGGAANTGMLHLALDGATLATTASAIQVVIGTGTPTDASLGYVLKIADTTTAPATPAGTYAVYASTTSNSAYLATTNALCTALTLSGPQAQTAPILKLDPVTGTGWVGAAGVGILQITHDTALAATDAAQVLLTASDAIDDSRGHCLRIVDSSNVDGTMGYPVSITSNDATMGGLIITTAAGATALSVVGGRATFAASIQILCSDKDSTNPPTNNECIAEFGAAATVGAGFIALIDDANGHANEYLIWSDGTKFWQITGTACA